MTNWYRKTPSAIVAINHPSCDKSSSEIKRKV